MAHPVIEYAGITFNTEQPDADGCRWNMPIPQGWTQRAQQVDVSEPTTGPGGDVAVNRTQPQPLVARWIVRAPNRTAAYAAWERSQLMPGVGTGRAAIMLVNTPVPKWLELIQTDADVPQPIDGRIVTAEVDLLALYPFKRGAAHTLSLAPGQTKTFENAGTEAAPLKVTVTAGGTVKLRQNTTGQVMQTRTTVAADVVLDSRQSLAFTPTGVLFFPMGSPSEWLSLPAGTLDAPSNTSLTNQGTATVDVSWFDTY